MTPTEAQHKIQVLSKQLEQHNYNYYVLDNPTISDYDFDQLSEWFTKDEYRWESKQFAKAAMAKAGKSQTKGTELLIMNYGK